MPMANSTCLMSSTINLIRKVHIQNHIAHGLVTEVLYLLNTVHIPVTCSVYSERFIVENCGTKETDAHYENELRLNDFLFLDHFDPSYCPMFCQTGSALSKCVVVIMQLR